MAELPRQITEILNVVVEEFDLSEKHADFFYTNAQDAANSTSDGAAGYRFPLPPLDMSAAEVIMVLRRLQELYIALLLKAQINELTPEED